LFGVSTGVGLGLPALDVAVVAGTCAPVDDVGPGVVEAGRSLGCSAFSPQESEVQSTNVESRQFLELMFTLSPLSGAHPQRVWQSGGARRGIEIREGFWSRSGKIPSRRTARGWHP
jgi:hypothetical protein